MAEELHEWTIVVSKKNKHLPLNQPLKFSEPKITIKKDGRVCTY